MESLAVSKKTDFTSCLNSVSAVGCIIPPIPPANSNITYDYDMARDGNHTILPFGHNVTYTCIDSRNFKFDEDYTKENFIVTCKDDGNWTDAHMPWTFCEDKRREYCLGANQFHRKRISAKIRFPFSRLFKYYYPGSSLAKKPITMRACVHLSGLVY